MVSLFAKTEAIAKEPELYQTFEQSKRVPALKLLNIRWFGISPADDQRIISFTALLSSHSRTSFTESILALIVEAANRIGRNGKRVRQTSRSKCLPKNPAFFDFL